MKLKGAKDGDHAGAMPETGERVLQKMRHQSENIAVER